MKCLLQIANLFKYVICLDDVQQSSQNTKFSSISQQSPACRNLLIGLFLHAEQTVLQDYCKTVCFIFIAL